MSSYTAIIGLLGVIAGASLQYLFARRTETYKQFQATKVLAYIDFVKAVANRTAAQRQNREEKEFEAISLLTDAKVRIAVYGSNEVASSVGDFFRQHGSLSTPEAVEAFTKVIQTMRQQTVGDNHKLTSEEIHNLLFW